MKTAILKITLSTLTGLPTALNGLFFIYSPHPTCGRIAPLYE
ncbi:hypothetical protein [Prolixibacter bellariivorans]|nr:hypothetical protein [Prolixibacter bellariivorans]